MFLRFFTAIIVWLSLPGSAMAAFDHQYTGYHQLLQKHVRWLPDNKQSAVDYAGLAKDKAELNKVLNEWSAVSQAEFAQFTESEQMAFLVNAYNGFTLQLVLTQYPKLKSIKDIGGVFSSPWKKEFFTLLGAKRNLDWIEHEQLRPKYQEPRVHAAVNCASIGCPALRNEAFTATKLNSQLNDGMRRFLSDRTRNRIANGKLEVSPIFKWFEEDFTKGYQGFKGLKDVFARWAKEMGNSPEEISKLESKSLAVGFGEYDWSLNDLKK